MARLGGSGSRAREDETILVRDVVEEDDACKNKVGGETSEAILSSSSTSSSAASSPMPRAAPVSLELSSAELAAPPSQIRHASGDQARGVYSVLSVSSNRASSLWRY